MTVYSYKAIDAQGASHKGVLDANDARQLRQQLRMRGWIPLRIEETSRTAAVVKGLRRTRQAFSNKTLTAFTGELAILIDGGLPLEKALRLIALQTPDLKLRERILLVHGQIVEGASFAGALETCSSDFPELYCATIAAGERVGNLSAVLGKLAEYGEIHQRTMTRVKLALLYPTVLAAFSTVVIIGLLTYVFPDIAKIFLQSGKKLPGLTVALISLSDLLRHWGLMIAAALAATGAAAIRALRDPKLKLRLHKLLLAIPLVSKLIISMELARFTGTLSMLRNSNVPLAEALKISSGVMSNRWMRHVTEDAMQGVTEGVSLNQALAKSGYFPPSFISMVAGGEASGELDRVLTLAARNQMKEMENRVLFGVAILEPVIILFMGLMVLLVVLAIMLPILNINQLVK